MRKFIIKTLLFSLPVVVLIVGVEIVLRTMPTIYSSKKEYLDEHADSIETLVLGTSHAFFGLNPDYLQHNSFNAANVSQTLDLDCAIVKKYDTRLKNLKTVIVPVSYFTLFEVLGKTKEKWRLKNYVIYFDMNCSGDFRHYSEFLSVRFPENVMRISGLLKGEKPEVTSLGWGTAYDTSAPEDLEVSGKGSAKRHTFKNYDLLRENITSLNAIAAICKKHNAKLILFTPPAYKAYYENLNKKQLELTIATINAFVQEHEGSSYVNLLKIPLFNAADFHDGDHLNGVGAKKLSMFFYNYISAN